MRKIRNPFLQSENYQCFGCSPRNACGLQMEFFEDGDEVISMWHPRDHLQGYGSVLHGGVQATAMDELASWAVFLKLKTAGVTSRLDVVYHKPVYTHRGEITLRASVQGVEDNRATISVRLFGPEGGLCSEASVVYFIFPPRLARKRLDYPGYEAFFE